MSAQRPAHLAPETVELKDGTALTLRPVRPDDAPRIARAFAALDRESVYTRFFGYRAAPTDAELARAVNVDLVREAMFVATVGGTGDEVVVGACRYVRAEGAGDAAEIAFAVEEDYQGRGIAGRLLERLARAARANGIARLEAVLLETNRSMLRVFERTGWPMTTRREDGTVVVTLAP